MHRDTLTPHKRWLDLVHQHPAWSTTRTAQRVVRTRLPLIGVEMGGAEGVGLAVLGGLSEGWIEWRNRAC